MLSDKQLLANQENARKSTGPRTEAGKKRSSLNALRHGLTGQVVVLPEEDLAAFKLFVAAIAATFQPFDAHESQLAHSYASCQWRINRIEAIETNMFTLGIMEEAAENLNLEHPEVHNAVSSAKTFRSDSKEFDRLSLYHQRLVNSAAKILKQLKDCQAERRRRQQQELDDATRLYKFHKMQSAAFEPKQHGFVLTVDQIQAAIRRSRLEDQASEAEKLDWDLIKFVKKYGQAA